MRIESEPGEGMQETCRIESAPHDTNKAESNELAATPKIQEEVQERDRHKYGGILAIVF